MDNIYNSKVAVVTGITVSVDGSFLTLSGV